jgi:hypothetical protein
MAHFAHTSFWYHYRRLPEDVQRIADRCFELLRHNPRHPSLHLKRVGQLWSVRVGRNHRAVAIEVEGNFFWTWIGPHDEYDRLLSTDG